MATGACMMTDMRFSVVGNPNSLELLVAKGERKTVVGDQIQEKDNQTYFAYDLVTSLGMRFSMSAHRGYEIPLLPTYTKVNWGANSLLAIAVYNLGFPAMNRDLAKQKDNLDTQLRRAFNESGIIQQATGASICGISPMDMETKLYVPASTAEEADQKMRNYGNTVSKILGPHKLKCGYKIKPVVKK